MPHPVRRAGAVVGLGIMLGGVSGPVANADAGTATAGSAVRVPSAVEAASASAPLLRRGDRGADVRAVQQRLQTLGYWVGPVDGIFGLLTQQAVYAVQKAAALARDGIVGPHTRSALQGGAHPTARSTSGHVVEVDLDRQLLLLVDGGRVRHVFNTSTGDFRYYTSGGTRHLADTPRGKWTIYRQVDGWDPSPLGRLYKPKYFNRQGIAIHGFGSVPPYAASHGCVRVSLPAITWMWNAEQLPINTPVWVY